MSRFCVATLAVCAASVLALQVFVSLQPAAVQATSHSGCADETTEQTFSPTVHGCNGAVAFASADSLCAAGWQPGDVVLDSGLTSLLNGTPGNSKRWIYMNGDPGPLLGEDSDHNDEACWGTQSPCPALPPNPAFRPVHQGIWSLHYNGVSLVKGDRQSAPAGSICVLPPPPPDVTITSPPVSSWQNFDASFPVGYDTFNVAACELETRDGLGPWTNRGPISCGTNQTTPIDAGAVCATEGFDQCRVRIEGFPSGCADGTTEQTFGTLPDGRAVSGCNGNGAVNFGNAGSLCTAGWNVGDVWLDNGLGSLLQSQQGTTHRWVRMNGDPGPVTGSNHSGTSPRNDCWGFPVVCSFPDPPNNLRPSHSSLPISVASTAHYNGILLAAGYIEGDNDVNNKGAICVGTPASPAQDERFFSIDASAPTVTTFTATDGATTVDATTDPLITTAGTITFNWTATDNPGGSGINHFELWRAPNAGGAPGAWSKIGPDMPPATTSTPHSPGGGAWWYSIHALDKANNQTSTNPILIIINQAPKVNAGSSRNIDFADPINLDATVTDDGLPSPPGALTIAWSMTSGPGTVTFGSPSAPDTTVTFSTPGLYVLRLTADDGQLSAFAEIEIGPLPHGLVPCGVDRDNPNTPNWNEKDPCEFKHMFLLVKNLIDFTLWKLTPIIVVIMVVATGAIFYFSLGSVNTLATVRRIWHYIGIGVLILAFSWLFLNFFMGILGFDINIFGRWTEIAV